MNFQYINTAYLDLMTDGDEAMQLVILEMIDEELPADLEKMKQLTTMGQWNELHSTCHRMKNTLPYVGNPTITNINKQLSAAAQLEKPDKTAILNLLTQFEQQALLALKELKALADSLN